MMENKDVKLIFEQGREGRAAYTLPRRAIEGKDLLGNYRRRELGLPQVSERQIAGFACEYSVDTVTETADTVDFCLVASGSATLEVGSAGCPMVVMYQTNRFLWHLLGRWLVHAPHLALINLLADRELVPEFMPYFASIDPIVDQVTAFLNDAKTLNRISNELIDLVEPLTTKHAGAEVARIVVGMLA